MQLRLLILAVRSTPALHGEIAMPSRLSLLMLLGVASRPGSAEQPLPAGALFRIGHAVEGDKKAQVLHVSHAADGITLALGYGDGRVTLHEAKTGNELRSLQLPGGRCTGLGWGPDDRLLAA